MTMIQSSIQSLIVLSVFRLNFLSVAADPDYCAICENHTMCLYEKDKPGPNCGDPENVHISHPMSDEVIKYSLDEHNRLRSSVACGDQEENHSPKSANMMKLEWDKELADICHRWLLQCGLEVDQPHDDCRDVMRNGSVVFVGQNVMQVWTNRDEWMSYKETMEKAFVSWFDETKTMTKEDFDGTERQNKNLHYTQLVWGTTRYVGCACNKRKNPNDPEFKITECCCNYAETGNFRNQPLYEVGTPCSQCPQGSFCSKSYETLCTYDESDKTNDGASTNNNSYSMYVLCMILMMQSVTFLQ